MAQHTVDLPRQAQKLEPRVCSQRQCVDEMLVRLRLASHRCLCHNQLVSMVKGANAATTHIRGLATSCEQMQQRIAEGSGVRELLSC